MELVFFYVVKSESGFIENTGFNFSPNYKFSVEYNLEDDVYILKQEECKTKLPHNFFDDTGCITNVTAIVGENGSGKTTLLNMLLNHTLDLYDKRSSKENEFYIAVYSYLDQLFCLYNVSQVVTDEIEVYDLSEYKKNISILSVTNSAYANLRYNPIVVSEKFNMCLHQKTVQTHLATYNKHYIHNKKFKKSNKYFHTYHTLINNRMHEGRFQFYLDVLYLQHIVEKQQDSIIAKNISKPLFVKFKTPIDVLEGCSVDFIYDNRNLDVEVQRKLFEKYRELTNDIRKYSVSSAFSGNIFICYINLLFEMLVYYTNLDSSFFLNLNSDNLKQNILQFLNTKKSKKFFDKYFIDAFYEIQEYEKLFVKSNDDCKWKCYCSKKFIPNSEDYFVLLELIKKSFLERKNSFVLRYIMLSDLNLASGERALLNFFSWIQFFTFHSKVYKNIPAYSLRDNILLLIDEMDLYCHPLWQQKLLKTFIEEAKSFFKGKKVQIILTTHSPIVLSDLPRSNIIFLERKNDKCSIYEDNLSNETFGANIYKLFDDAFFLEKKGQIGEFAREKIQGIIDKIKPEIRDGETIYPELSFDEIYNLEQQISLIGEPIIRDKLFDMLYKNYPELAIKKKIQRYESELKKLHNLKNGGGL